MQHNALLNNRYRLIQEEGSGGMSVVYKAQDLELDRLVAVKVLKPELTSDPEFLIRFREEARAAANLSHPNIVTVFDVGQDDRTHYIVLEYVPGNDLKQLIMTEAPFDVGSTLLIMIELCKGLGYAHRAGLVHADVKPQNVLVTNQRRVLLADFGLARALSASYSTEELEEIVWGSPSYLAPERFSGEPPTPVSDVYSLGIIMFELLTGRLPFAGDDHTELARSHMQDELPPISRINALVPVELEQIVRKVLSKEPAQRYRTADQLGRILIKYREQGEEATAGFPVMPSQPGRSVPQPPQPPPPQPEQPDEPVLPPLDIDKYTQRASQRETMIGSQARTAQMQSPFADPSQPEWEYEEDGQPTIDLYAIALGVLAFGAVLGLIPLWLSVLRAIAR